MHCICQPYKSFDTRPLYSRRWELNIFEYRDRLVDDYASYVESFIQKR
jgi:hypothetical protein